MCGLLCMDYDVRFEKDRPDQDQDQYQDQVPMCADKHTVAGQSLVCVRAWAELIGIWRGIFVRLGLGQSAPDLRCTWQGADQHWRSTQKTIPYSNLLLST